ncbi:hypothetical protein EV199_5431 [Pseudobacter ginsenosidimutans]|uniref:Uncharacterized protein n=1 Tax=Pseudobacter ginsenosidimutans TaxID=661488 RepID=A0A4Q7MH91_9BACT|nr:hypothetical protein EV199_5431 [Pseudobacter ginsenosidimutans]
MILQAGFTGETAPKVVSNFFRPFPSQKTQEAFAPCVLLCVNTWYFWYSIYFLISLIVANGFLLSL